MASLACISTRSLTAPPCVLCRPLLHALDLLARGVWHYQSGQVSRPYFVAVAATAGNSDRCTLGARFTRLC